MDNQYADDVMSVNSNPWLSEAARQKKVSLLQDKYENKKNALVDRLRLSESLVGRAIDTYYKERQFQQNQIEMALNLRNREIEKQDRQIQQDFENQLAMEKFELEKIKREDKIKIIKPEEYNKLLSVDEATKFGVPFGTTRGEVVGKVPAAISQLGIEATKTRENAISGLGALKVVEDEINKDMKILLKAAAPGAIFARKFETARKEASDVITRLRTGAALNESEERFYKSQLPSILDYGNKEAINYKIELFRSLFERLQKSSPIQSFQSQNNDPLGIR